MQAVRVKTVGGSLKSGITFCQEVQMFCSQNTKRMIFFGYVGEVVMTIGIVDVLVRL